MERIWRAVHRLAPPLSRRDQRIGEGKVMRNGSRGSRSTKILVALSGLVK
jgi:hypothetical protein